MPKLTALACVLALVVAAAVPGALARREEADAMDFATLPNSDVPMGPIAGSESGAAAAGESSAGPGLPPPSAASEESSSSSSAGTPDPSASDPVGKGESSDLGAAAAGERINATPTDEGSAALGEGSESAAGVNDPSNMGALSESSTVAPDGRRILIGGTRIGQLSPNAKPFVEKVDANCGQSAGQCEDSNEESSVMFPEDQSDPVMKELYSKLKKIHDQMITDKQWIQQVSTIIAHYKLKIRGAQQGLRTQALTAYHIKDLIRNQHQILARKRLEDKLQSVNEAIAKMDLASQDATSKSAALEAVRNSLHSSIQAIEYEVSKLKKHV